MHLIHKQGSIRFYVQTLQPLENHNHWVNQGFGQVNRFGLDYQGKVGEISQKRRVGQKTFLIFGGPFSQVRTRLRTSKGKPWVLGDLIVILSPKKL